MAVEVQINSSTNQSSRDRMKRYYRANRDHILQCSMEYYNKNKETILNYRKQHKERITNYFRTKKTHCDLCGVDVLIGSKANHLKSRNHIFNQIKQENEQFKTMIVKQSENKN